MHNRRSKLATSRPLCTGDMLIQSSLPDSVRTLLLFSPNHVKQEITDLPHDWSCFDKTWQNSSSSELDVGNKEKKLLGSKEFELLACSDLSTVTDMCASSTAKSNGYVYKRRKLMPNGVALLTEENSIECSKETDVDSSNISSEDHNFAVKNHVITTTPGCQYTYSSGTVSLYNPNYHQDRSSVSELQKDDARATSAVNIGLLTTKDIQPAKSFKCSKTTLGQNSRISSENNNVDGSIVFRNEVEDAGECSSSGNITAEPVNEFVSARELCISVLRSHGLLGSVCSRRECATLGVQDNEVSKSFQICKVCGLLEDPLTMLICDLCEEAFHLSCCNARARKLPVGEWYCQPCSRMKPAVAPYFIGKISEQNRRTSYGDLGPIEFMLRDRQLYTSGVRISKDFQAEVPDWSGPVSDDKDVYLESTQVKPSQYSSVERWNTKSSKSPSIGNWVQCREIIHTSEVDEGTVCGKWRRAPLFLEQTDDWDCSCAVLWDPIHADCAVPQELETEEILKHLKFVHALRPKLAKKK